MELVLDVRYMFFFFLFVFVFSSFFLFFFVFFFSSRRRHTRWTGDWSSDVCSSDLIPGRWKSFPAPGPPRRCRGTDRFWACQGPPGGAMNPWGHAACGRVSPSLF